MAHTDERERAFGVRPRGAQEFIRNCAEYARAEHGRAGRGPASASHRTSAAPSVGGMVGAMVGVWHFSVGSSAPRARTHAPTPRPAAAPVWCVTWRSAARGRDLVRIRTNDAPNTEPRNPCSARIECGGEPRRRVEGGGRRRGGRIQSPVAEYKILHACMITVRSTSDALSQL